MLFSVRSFLWETVFSIVDSLAWILTACLSTFTILNKPSWGGTGVLCPEFMSRKIGQAQTALPHWPLFARVSALNTDAQATEQ